jgi:transketolase
MKIDPTKPADPGRDRLILSKGHAAMALYTVLAMRGFFPEEELATFNTDGARLQEHPGPHCAPGVEAATGSLGHGLPVGLGMALSGKMRGQDFRVTVVMSDGECNEGSVWEAALFGAAEKLPNVTAVIDFNKWQATGRSTEVLCLQPLADKWKAFGWDVHEIDGHDMAALVDILNRAPDPDGRPRAVVANTVKGRGVSFMEDDNNWHYRIPKEEEVEQAYRELGLS